MMRFDQLKKRRVIVTPQLNPTKRSIRNGETNILRHHLSYPTNSSQLLDINPLTTSKSKPR
jgi:hypothetical protein